MLKFERLFPVRDNVFVAIIPFMFDVNIPVVVEYEMLLFEITLDVATTPFIVVVSTFPDRF